MQVHIDVLRMHFLQQADQIMQRTPEPIDRLRGHHVDFLSRCNSLSSLWPAAGHPIGRTLDASAPRDYRRRVLVLAAFRRSRTAAVASACVAKSPMIRSPCTF
jgi:hypothetical protein